MKIDKKEIKLLGITASQYTIDDNIRAIVSMDRGRLHLSASYLDHRKAPAPEEISDIISMVFEDKPWFVVAGGVIYPNMMHIWESKGNDEQFKSLLDLQTKKLLEQRKNRNAN